MRIIMFRKMRTTSRLKRPVWLFVLGCFVFTGYAYIGNSGLYEENFPKGVRFPVTKLTQHTTKENRSDAEDYTSYTRCPPPIDIHENRNISHRKLQIQCGVGRAELSSVLTTDTEVLSINSGEPCLYNAIRKYCPLDGYRVPNLVHYIWFDIQIMSFYHFLSFMSVHLFQAPCLILVHGDLPGGPYWRYLIRLVPNIIHVSTLSPATFGGKQIASNEHKSDVIRLFVLNEYGGVYLDLDSILLRSLDSLRNYPVTMSLEYWSNLSNGLILAEPSAKFTRKWLSYYLDYTMNPDDYYEFSLFIPTKIARQNPEWIHVEYMTFCTPDGEHREQIFEENFDWGKNFAMHLYIRFYPKEHNCDDVRNLNTTIGALARFVLYDTRKLCVD